MKKIGIFALILGLVLILNNGCAETETFIIDNGGNESTIVAEPYGWMNQHKKIDNVEYQICVGNIVWDIILCETIIVPIILTGVALYEPIGYDYTDEMEENLKNTYN